MLFTGKKPTEKKEIRFGLDIGTRLIKALELSLEEGGVQKLTKLHSAEIDFPLNEDKTAAALKALLEDFNPSVKEANIALSAPSAIVRFINMPKMTEADLRNSLRYEAEKYIPFNIKEVITDATILGYPAGDKTKMRVLLAAVKRKAVDSRIAMLKNLGFSVSIIDVDSFACFNAFCNSSGNLDESKSIALLNIGYTQTNLIVSQGANPFFIRDIQIGARDIAKAISKELGVEEEKSDKAIFDPKDNEEKIYSVAKSVLNKLFDELRLSFGYYENQHGRSINEIYISGGLARLEGISKYFQENFKITATPWNPFLKFEINPAIDAKSLEPQEGRFAICAGLAIRR